MCIAVARSILLVRGLEIAQELLHAHLTIVRKSARAAQAQSRHKVATHERCAATEMPYGTAETN